MTDQDKADAVTAAFNGHNMMKWVPPRRSAVTSNVWVVTALGENLVGHHYFHDEEKARRFYKTGEMPSD